MTENQLSNVTIGCAGRVHGGRHQTSSEPSVVPFAELCEIFAWLLESSYVACLHFELVKSGLFVEIQKALPLVYEDVKLECGYRIDVMVERKLIVEVKSVQALNDLHFAQVLTYLRLSDSRLGLLMNFNVLRLKDGIRRVVNHL